MKLKFVFAGASLLVLSACGTSQDALQALQSMQILEEGKPAPTQLTTADGGKMQLQDQSQSFISYEKLSGSGNDVTLQGVSFKAPASVAAMMAEDGEGEGKPLPPVAVAPGEDKPHTPHVTATTPGGAATVIAKAETMKLSGLTMKDGKPVARDIVVSGVTPAFPTEGATIRVGSIGLEGMNELTGKFIAGAFTKEGPGETPKFADWVFSKASINGVSVGSTIPQDDGPAGSVNVQLGELSFSNLKDQTLGLARVSGIKGDLDIPGMPAVKGTFDFGTAEVEKFRAGMYVDLVSAVIAAMQPNAAKPDIAKAMAGFTSPLEAGFDVSRWTGAKADVSGVKFNVSPVETRATRNADGVVVALNSPRYTMALTADSAGGTLGAMGMMGMAMMGYPSNVIEFYGESHATFDPVKDLTRWDNYNFGVTDLFDIKSSGGMLGVEQAMPAVVSGIVGIIQAAEKAELAAPTKDEDADEDDSDEGDDADAEDDDGDAADEAEEAVSSIMQNPEVMGAAMQMVFGLMSLQVTDLDVSITDKKLVDLILTQVAMQSGQSASAYRQDLATQVKGAAELLTGVGVDVDIANEATTAIAGFLSGPGTLHIQLKPKSPVGAMSLMMSPTKESLGFSATFTPAAK